MNYLDTQLQKIQEIELKEIDPLTGSLAIGTSYLIGSLAYLFLAVGSISKALKADKPLSKRLNEILRSGNHWIVHKYPDKTPNAFALGMGRHIFITTGLLNILDTREVEAVMLHEIYHNKNKDTYKSLAYKHSFFYLITFIALSITTFPLGLLVFLFLLKANNIAYARFLGRRQEIKADKFAVEHGYGTELISGLQKIDKFVEKQHAKVPCGQWCQLERKVSNIIDEHPPTKKRVEIILRKTDKLIKISNFVKIKDFLARVFKQNG